MLRDWLATEGVRGVFIAKAGRGRTATSSGTTAPSNAKCSAPRRSTPFSRPRSSSTSGSRSTTPGAGTAGCVVRPRPGTPRWSSMRNQSHPVAAANDSSYHHRKCTSRRGPRSRPRNLARHPRSQNKWTNFSGPVTGYDAPGASFRYPAGSSGGKRSTTSRMWWSSNGPSGAGSGGCRPTYHRR